jgi:hypothetical protein
MANTFKSSHNSHNSHNDLSKQLIGSIFAQQNISNFKYEVIQYESDLSKLIRQKFFTSINFCGTNSLLVFTKISGKHYCFTVERQTLSYNFSKIDYSKVKLDMRNLRLDIDIYNGTILDGILVKQSKKDDLFIISDVYKFCGVDYTKSKLDDKLKMIIKYLQNNYNQDHIENNILLSVNKIYPIAQTEHIVNNVLPSIKSLKARGLCFYPEFSETKLIFLFNNDNKKIDSKEKDNKDSKDNKDNKDNKDKDTKVNIIKNDKIVKHDTHEKNEKHDKHEKHVKHEKDDELNLDKPKFKYVNTSKKDVYATLEIKSTPNVDVYKLNAVERVTIDGKKVLKRIAMGIAYISGIEQSHKMNKIFSQEKKVLMKCKFINDKSKWEPIEVDKSAPHPTLLEDINLELMEISDDEDN